MKKSSIRFLKGKKVKKILAAVLAGMLLSAAVIAGIYYKSLKTDYQDETKSAIAMGTVVTSRVYDEFAALRNEKIISIVQQLEELISRNVKDSAVDRLNRGQTVSLGELSFLLASAKSVSEKTGGAFDLTIGNVTSLWDFGGDNERLPEKEEIEEALKTVDYTKVSSENGICSIGKGQNLDLGAVGKGYACDMIKAYLEGTETKGAVVSVGGSILAYGERNKAGDKWKIAIRHPRDEKAFLGTVFLDEGFVSTSGDYEKYFEKDGKRYHHILDARTGYPAESDLISVTIVAENGLLSDALSTACFILGSEEGKALAESCGVGAVFVDRDENISVIGDVDFKKAK